MTDRIRPAKLWPILLPVNHRIADEQGTEEYPYQPPTTNPCSSPSPARNASPTRTLTLTLTPTRTQRQRYSHSLSPQLSLLRSLSRYLSRPKKPHRLYSCPFHLIVIFHHGEQLCPTANPHQVGFLHRRTKLKKITYTKLYTNDRIWIRQGISHARACQEVAC